MGVRYYLKRGKKVLGPFSIERISKLKQSNQLQIGDEISQTNMGPWKPIANLEGRKEISPPSVQTPAWDCPTPPVTNESSKQGHRSIAKMLVFSLVLLVGAGAFWVYYASSSHQENNDSIGVPENPFASRRAISTQMEAASEEASVEDAQDLLTNALKSIKADEVNEAIVQLKEYINHEHASDKETATKLLKEAEIAISLDYHEQIISGLTDEELLELAASLVINDGIVSNLSLIEARKNVVKTVLDTEVKRRSELQMQAQKAKEELQLELAAMRLPKQIDNLEHLAKFPEEYPVGRYYRVKVKSRLEVEKHSGLNAFYIPHQNVSPFLYVSPKLGRDLVLSPKRIEAAIDKCIESEMRVGAVDALQTFFEGVSDPFQVLRSDQAVDSLQTILEDAGNKLTKQQLNELRKEFRFALDAVREGTFNKIHRESISTVKNILLVSGKHRDLATIVTNDKLKSGHITQGQYHEEFQKEFDRIKPDNSKSFLTCWVWFERTAELVDSDGNPVVAGLVYKLDVVDPKGAIIDTFVEDTIRHLFENDSSNNKPKESNGVIQAFTFDSDTIETSRGAVKDTSGNGVTGFLKGATIVEGLVGECLRFSKGNSLTFNDSHLPSGIDPRTVSLWIKTPQQSRQRGIPFTYGRGADNAFTLIVFEQSMPAIQMKQTLTLVQPGDDRPQANVSSQTRVADNQWHHIVVTYGEESGVSIYVDGELEAEKQVTKITSLKGTAVIGNLLPNDLQHGFNGLIDEFLIYDRVISSEEVKLLYEETLAKSKEDNKQQ